MKEITEKQYQPAPAVTWGGKTFAAAGWPAVYAQLKELKYKDDPES